MPTVDQQTTSDNDYGGKFIRRTKSAKRASDSGATFSRTNDASRSSKAFSLSDSWRRLHNARGSSLGNAP
jgi:hypothetical protein